MKADYYYYYYYYYFSYLEWLISAKVDELKFYFSYQNFVFES